MTSRGPAGAAGPPPVDLRACRHHPRETGLNMSGFARAAIALSLPAHGASGAGPLCSTDGKRLGRRRSPAPPVPRLYRAGDDVHERGSGRAAPAAQQPRAPRAPRHGAGELDGIPRRHHRQRRAPPHRRGPRCRRHRPPVGDHRLPAAPGVADPPRRRARRPVRPAQGVRDRLDLVRDRVGRVRVAPNLELLVVARMLQGVGGALLAPTSLALTQSSFVQERPGRRGRRVVGPRGARGAIGPFLGGWLVDGPGWRWAFLLNLPLVLLALLAARTLPESRRPRDAATTSTSRARPRGRGARRAHLGAHRGRPTRAGTPRRSSRAR